MGVVNENFSSCILLIRCNISTANMSSSSSQVQEGTQQVHYSPPQYVQTVQPAMVAPPPPGAVAFYPQGQGRVTVTPQGQGIPGGVLMTPQVMLVSMRAIKS